MAALGTIGLLALAFLAGHLFYRAFAPPDDKGSWAEVLFVQILAGVLLCGWPALLLAELGLFSLHHLALLLLVACAIVVVWRWPRVRDWRWPRLHVGRRGLAALLLFLGAVALLLWPGERILGGNDPGVYLATGASIARTGGIVLQDAQLAAVPSELRPALFSTLIGQWWLLPGFYVTDWASGEVTPQFLHLYPTWLALFCAAGGLDLALLAIPAFPLLGLGALYFLTRRVVGRGAAPVALVLLALNPAMIWFSREPMSETLAMVLVIGGWYLLDRALGEPGRRDLAVLAGIALGQVGLTKIEFLFLPLLLYGYFFLRSTVARLGGPERAFLLAYSVVWGHALLHMGLVSRPYLRTFVTSLGRSRFVSLTGTTLLLLGSGVALLGIVLFLIRRRLGPLVAWLNGRAAALRQGAAVLWLVLACYGGVVRPLVAPRWVEVQGEIVFNYERLLFPRLSWYLSLPGLVLAVLGIWWWTRRRLAGPSLVFYVALLLELAIYTHRSMDYPYHFWMMRRYLPLIFPFMTMGIAAALRCVRLAPLGPVVRRAGAALLLGLLLFLAVQADAPFSSRRELAGIRAALADLASRVPDGRPLFIENRGAALATPLRYIEGKEAFALPEPVPWEALWRLPQVWPAGEDTTYLLVDGPPAVLHGGFSLVGSGPFTLDVVGTEQTLDHLPRDAVHVRTFQQLLRVQRRPAAPHALELSLHTPAWTADCLAVMLPAWKQPLSLRLEVAGFRPRGLPPAHLRVLWEGVLVTETTLERSWQLREVVLRLPPAPERATTGDGARLELCVETWNPQEAGYSDDLRDLGILLKSVVIEEGK